MIGGARIACIGVGLAIWFATSAGAATWRVMPSPAGGALNAVFCTSPTACTAVGLIDSGPFQSGSILAERWNGTSWSIQPEVAPPWRGQSEWTAVTCAGPRFCMATGEVVASSTFTGRFRTIIGIWRGARWKVTWAAHGGPGASVRFGDTLGLLSCVSSRFCVAGGWGLTSRRAPGVAPSARSWNGTRWSVMPTARGVPAPESVLCARRRACLGISGNTFERWDGSRWSRAGRMPAPTRLQSVTWGGLACRTTTSCIDVGLGYPGGDSSPVSLVAEWHGTGWILNSPEDSLQSSSVDWGPSSCTSALGCLVLGNKMVGMSLAQHQAESWIGTRWKTFPAPISTTTDPSALFDISGVSCVATSCFAVGYTGDPSQTLVERYG